VTKQSPKVRTNLHERCTERVKLKVVREIPHERLIKESTVPKHTFRVGNPIHKNINDQRLTNRKIPSKMKGKVITKLRKINSKMKGNLGTKWPKLIQGKKTDKKVFF
jgi:nitrogenase subunit NifH